MITRTRRRGAALRQRGEQQHRQIHHAQRRQHQRDERHGFVRHDDGAGGNDNNTIDNCDIRDGATTPSNGIYSAGTTATAAQNNSGNTVSNCNIFNFYRNSGTTDSTGVLLAGGNTDWTITGNSFYQTVSRAETDGTHRAVQINTTSGNNFTVANNFIGGSAANAGGAACTTTGTTRLNRFVGIQLRVGTTTPSSVQGNTIRNIVWTSSMPPPRPACGAGFMCRTAR